MKCENCVRPDPCGGKVSEDGECGLHRTAEEWKREHADENEPLAVILREMRGNEFDDPHLDRDGIIGARRLARDWADRIEAAYKREHAEAKDYFAKLHDGPSMICTAKNCAVRNVGISLAAAPRKFDEAAFDEAVSEPNGWSDVADPVAEIRKMRGDEQPGNAAALREALGKLTDAVRNYFGWDDAPAVQDRDDPTAYFCAEMSAALAALAAPARNCDRPECATAEGAIAALRANPCADHDFCKEQLDCAECAARWLVATAEGGDHD